MKTLPLIAIVAAFAAFAGNASAETLCAEKGRWGWKIDGPDFSANYTDWQANKAIGQFIGDGNCQDGWTMVHTVDPRIQISGGKVVFDDVVVGTETVTRTKTNTTSVFDGRITSAYNGTAPDVLKGRRAGAADKWKLVSRDGNGGGIYRVVKPGNTSRPKGTQLHFTSDMLVARDNQSGTATTNPYWHRNFRYDQYKDVTTSHTFDAEVPVMGKERRVVSRTFCPSVNSWTFVAPSGEAVATTQGKVGECVTKIITK